MITITRRNFLKCGAGASATLALPWTVRQAFAARPARSVLTKYIQPLPTPLWAYDDGSGLAGQAGSFGMAVVAQSGTPLDVSYTNDLPEIYPDWIPVDTRLTPGMDNKV